MKIVECVPNFSEGRDKAKIDAIVNAISSVSGVKVLDVDPGEATNRTVVTFIGSPEAVKEAAFQGIKKAAEVIDMRTHKGEHPRMGATDVCPFVPVSGVTMEDCVQIAREVGKRVGEELGIPVYLYEEAATADYRRNLADIRAGEYEGLKEKLQDEKWKPDFGPSEWNENIAKTGATVIGAREFLIAYNINLNTRNKKIATDIALDIREKGRRARGPDGKFLRDENGEYIMKPGRLKYVKAIGWYIEEYGIAQISINLTNYKKTPLWKVFETAVEEAEKRGVRVTGSEIVGLVPKAAILDAGRHFLEKMGLSPGVPEEELIHIAIRSLGLDEFGEFDPQKKIIEYQIPRDTPLVNMNLRTFANEVSVDSPAPGGGSVSAYAGALAASLGAMVANLTANKRKKFADVKPDMEHAAVELQRIKDGLLDAVDRDTEAFNDVIAAMRMPHSTPEEEEARNRAIEEGYKSAARVPLHTAELCLEAMPYIKEIGEKGNPASITDVAVAALMARSAVHGACLNVLINLGEIGDEAFVNDMKARVEELRRKADEMEKEIMEIVSRVMEEK